MAVALERLFQIRIAARISNSPPTGRAAGLPRFSIARDTLPIYYPPLLDATFDNGC